MVTVAAPGRLWIDTPEGPRLVAAACSACRARVFPATPRCRICGAPADEVTLASTGVIESWSGSELERVGEVRLDSGELLLGRLLAAAGVGARVRFEPVAEVVGFSPEG